MSESVALINALKFKFLNTLFEPVISSVWRIDVTSESKLTLRAWTEAKEKIVKTGCPPWSLHL